MPDTARTLPALQTLLADNVAGDISAQDVRDFLVSAWTPGWARYLQHRLPDETAHADDDFFDDDTFSGWTTVTITGSQTITEARDVLSVAYSGQSASDVNGVVKAIPAGPPLTIETSFRQLNQDINFKFMGMVFADGTTATDGVAVVDFGAPGPAIDYIRGGTWTVAGAPTQGTLTMAELSPGRIYLRFVWESANSFSANWSPDGVNWSDWGGGAEAITLTPTHMGLMWSTWGGGSTGLVSFDYFRVYEADLSV